MASRLYRTTRQLYLAVEAALVRLHLNTLGTPTWAALIALAVTGLILLDARPTQTRVARVLPARCHDALNRLLRAMPCSTRALSSLLIAFAKRLSRDGYLVLDDVIVEKAFAKRLPWAGKIYSFAKKRKLWGIHIVVLLWCSCDGVWRIPVGFRLWRPKRSCRTERYRTKLQLATELVTQVVAAKLPVRYVVGDTHYSAGWFGKRLARLGLTWHGTLDPKTTVVWRGRKQAVRELAPQLHLKWRKHLGLRAKALRVYAPKYGQLRLVVTKNRHGNYEYLVSNDLQADLSRMVLRKRSRWSIEIVFSQVTKTDVGTRFCGWNDIANFDLCIGDDHTIDQQFDQLTTLGKGGLRQSCLEALTQCLDGGDACARMVELFACMRQLPRLDLQVIALLNQLALPALEFAEFNCFGQVRLQQAFPLAVEAVERLLEAGLPMLNLVWQPRPTLRPLQC